jgi:hypothetical protein
MLSDIELGFEITYLSGGANALESEPRWSDCGWIVWTVSSAVRSNNFWYSRYLPIVVQENDEPKMQEALLKEWRLKILCRDCHQDIESSSCNFLAGSDLSVAKCLLLDSNYSGSLLVVAGQCYG